MATATNPSVDPETGKPPRCRRPVPIALRVFLAMNVTLFVVGSLWIGVPIFQRYAAVRALRQIGGRLSFNKTGPAKLRNYLGDSGMEIFDDVDWVCLNDTSFSDSHVKYLNVFTTVRGIELDGTQVTDSGLSQLANFTRLDCLSLKGTAISDAGLARTAGLNKLTRLALDDTHIGDCGFRHISKIRNLRDLRAKGTNVTDAGLSHLSGMPELRRLFLDRTQVTDLGLKHLSDCTKLSILFVKETQVTVEGAAQLRAAAWRVDVFGPDRKRQTARLQELLPHVIFTDRLDVRRSRVTIRDTSQATN
jgi:hypothetical protein